MKNYWGSYFGNKLLSGIGVHRNLKYTKPDSESINGYYFIISWLPNISKNL